MKLKNWLLLLNAINFASGLATSRRCTGGKFYGVDSLLVLVADRPTGTKVALLQTSEHASIYMFSCK